MHFDSFPPALPSTLKSSFYGHCGDTLSSGHGTVFLVFLSSWQLWLLTGDLHKTGPTNLRVTRGPQRPHLPGEAQLTAAMSQGLPQSTAACKLPMLPQLTRTSSLLANPDLGAIVWVCSWCALCREQMFVSSGKAHVRMRTYGW